LQKIQNPQPVEHAKAHSCSAALGVISIRLDFISANPIKKRIEQWMEKRPIQSRPIESSIPELQYILS
jgi:hypothetical protein